MSGRKEWGDEGKKEGCEDSSFSLLWELDVIPPSRSTSPSHPPLNRRKKERSNTHKSLISVVVVPNWAASGKREDMPSEELKSGTKAAKQYIATMYRDERRESEWFARGGSGELDKTRVEERKKRHKVRH